MKLMFIGADHEVTGSCHYLEVGEKKILIDCGKMCIRDRSWWEDTWYLL